MQHREQRLSQQDKGPVTMVEIITVRMAICRLSSGDAPAVRP